MTALIKADDISFASGSKTILSHVSMELNPGEILTIIGPNGAGKTTLLRILINLMQPTSGTVSYPKPVTFGYMPQKLRLNSTMPIQVSTFLNTGNLSNNPEKQQQLNEIMDELNIAGLYEQSMHQLSGGEMQRVLLARALMRKPDVLVLDEPGQGIDIGGQNRLYELIEEVRDRYQCAVLMVSHDLHLVMAKTDRVICLNQHVCCHGHPEAVSSDQEYLSLFGDISTAAMAPYTHHHDHHHDLHGEVIKGEHNESCKHDH